MPIKYENEHPELYEEARRLFFGEGIKSPAKIRDRIKNKFGENKTPHWRTFDRWREGWEEELEKVVQEGIATLNKEERPTEDESESFIAESESVDQDDKRSRKRDKELPKPPTLIELVDTLIQSGVPKKSAQKMAPGLLADWEIAYREDDYVLARTCERAGAILREVPGIPYKKALALANFEAKLEDCGIDSGEDGQHIFDLINIYKRYRPWDGKENQRAYQKMVNWWFEKTKPVREKIHAEAERATASFFSAASQKEGK